MTDELTHDKGYRVIKRDLLRLFFLNIVYLAVFLGLYFANQKSHFLDKWFAGVFQF